MHLTVILRILGLLLMIFSLTLFPPILVSLYYQDGTTAEFALAFMLTFSTGLACWAPARNTRQELRIRDCFLIVTLFWTVLGSFGAIPFFVSEELDLSLTDAIFESISGLTTTGATILSGLDTLPKPCCITANNYSGWAAWVSLQSPLPSCQCWELAACNFTRLKVPVR